MSGDERSLLNRVQDFSQADPHVVQRPPATDVATKRGTRELNQPRGIIATPGGWKENWEPTNQTIVIAGAPILVDEQTGFPVHSILIDNWTNQWVWCDTVRRYVPPYTGGVVFNVPSASQQVRLTLQAPPGIGLSGVVAGQFVWWAAAEELLPPSSGFSLVTSGNQPPGAVQHVQIQDTGTTTTASLATQAYESTLKADGALMVETTAGWAVTNTAAVGSASSVSRAPAGVGISHRCTTVSFGFSATTALAGITTVTINLRDGGPGAGTVLFSWSFTLPAATLLPFAISLTGLNFLGTANNAMTLEFAAGIGNLLTFVNLGGYDV